MQKPRSAAAIDRPGVHRPARRPSTGPAAIDRPGGHRPARRPSTGPAAMTQSPDSPLPQQHAMLRNTAEF
ncbi:unnamed protein product [Boreogadus saida]